MKPLDALAIYTESGTMRALARRLGIKQTTANSLIVQARKSIPDELVIKLSFATIRTPYMPTTWWGEIR